MVSERLLDKLQKLKAMADGAKAISSEHEAQAFADALQRLLLEHDLQLSDLEFERLEKEEPIEDSYVDYALYGIKVKRTRVSWMESLADMVARTNFCRILVTGGTSNFWLVGRREHRAVAEYLIVTLTRAIESIATKEYGAYYRECIRRDGNPHAARGFRESFIAAFLIRLFQRFEERKRSAVTSTSTALMRLNREDRAVEDEMQRRREIKKGQAGHVGRIHGLGDISVSHREGSRRGYVAAERVNIEGRAIETERRPVGRLK